MSRNRESESRKSFVKVNRRRIEKVNRRSEVRYQALKPKTPFLNIDTLSITDFHLAASFNPHAPCTYLTPHFRSLSLKVNIMQLAHLQCVPNSRLSEFCVSRPEAQLAISLQDEIRKHGSQSEARKEARVIACSGIHL